MPYTASSVPDHIPKRKRDQWAATWNSAFEKYGDEGRAFQIANGVAMRVNNEDEQVAALKSARRKVKHAVKQSAIQRSLWMSKLNRIRIVLEGGRINRMIIHLARRMAAAMIDSPDYYRNKRLAHAAGAVLELRDALTQGRRGRAKVALQNAMNITGRV